MTASGDITNTSHAGTNCPICGVTLVMPGYSAQQAAEALRQHMQANHGGGNITGTTDSTEAPDVQVESNPDGSADASETRDGGGESGTEERKDSAGMGLGYSRDDAPFGRQRATMPTPAPSSEGRGGAPESTTGNGAAPPTSGRTPGPVADPAQIKEPQAAAQAPDRQALGGQAPANGKDAGKPGADGTAKTAGQGTNADKQEGPMGGVAKKLLGGGSSRTNAAGRKTGAGGRGAKSPTQPTGGERSSQAMEKAAQAAAAAVGVPPIATKAVLYFSKKILPYLLAVMLMLFVAIFGGSAFNDDPPEDTVWSVSVSDQLDIPEAYLEAYQNTARQYKLPWTLLAAVGAQATYHGRINPYLQSIPAPGGRSGGGSVLLIGDSLSVGTDPYLQPLLAQQGLGYRSVVEVGTRTSWGIDQLVENPAEPTAVIVVGFGTNDSGGAVKFGEDIDRLMNTVRTTNTVWWLTLEKPEYNQVIREKSQQWRNLRVADWKGHADRQDPPITPGSDGIHYGSDGYQERARFVSSVLTGNFANAGAVVTGELSGEGVIPVVEGDCPTLPTPVEGEEGAKKLSQGAGPLMLVPAALAVRGIDLKEKVQNICDSLDALGEVLSETAAVVAEERGISYPRGLAFLARDAGAGDSEAVTKVHEFWVEVVDRAGILGSTSVRKCRVPDKGSIPDEEYVGVAIATYWRCELANASLHSVSKVSVGNNGVLQIGELDPSAAIARGVEEALSVAWTFSNWGEMDCDANADVAGVFPLDKETFAAYRSGDVYDQSFNKSDRCDKNANIAVAARAFAAGESLVAAARGGRWATSLGGWSLIEGVTGTDPRFDELGPWTPLSPSVGCSQVLVNAAVSSVSESDLFAGRTAGGVQSYLVNGIPSADLPAVDELLTGIIDAGSGNALCVDTRARSTSEWLGALGGAVTGDALDGVDGNMVIPPVTDLGTRADFARPVGVGDVLAVVVARAYELSVESAPVATYGSTPLLARLSSERIVVAGRPYISLGDDGGSLSLGSRILNIAVGYYGGVFVGEGGQSVLGFGLLDGTVPYYEEFNSVGQELNVDPRLLAAVAKQESNFNPEAGCPSTGPAYGMMQKEPDMVPTVCGDVRRQIQVAAEMLLARFEEAGDWRGALWGYNNGGTYSKQWRELGGDVASAAAWARNRYCSDPDWAGAREDGQLRCEWRADIAMSYVSDDPSTRSAYVNWLEYQRLFPAMVITAYQTSVSGSECPSTGVSLVPGKTLLRDGAEQIGMKTLCAESVAQAASPEAARAIIYAFKHLGAPYTPVDEGRRNWKDHYDCSSYYSRSWESTGVLMSSSNWPFTTHTLMPWDGRNRPEYIVEIPSWETRPGDMVFPFEGHVSMVLARGYMIHTDRRGDVSKVERIYASPVQFNRVLPELAPRVPANPNR